MKTSRRKIIKLFGLSAAALAISPLAGCENAVDELVSRNLSNPNETDAVNLVKQFCEASISGNISTNKRVLSKTIGDFEPAWDFMAVVNDYKIVSSKAVGNTVKVNVEFEYIGVHKGDDFYFYQPKNGHRKITAKYRVENGKLKNGRTPFTQTELYKIHLRKLLDANVDCVTRYADNEFMRNHFIATAEKYRNVLAALG